MRNPINSGARLEVAAPEGGYTTGQVATVGKLIGIVQKGVAEGETAVIHLTGSFIVAKEAPLAVAQGDKLFWDADNEAATTTDTGVFLGHAFEAAAEDDTEVQVRLSLAGSELGGGDSPVPAVKSYLFAKQSGNATATLVAAISGYDNALAGDTEIVAASGFAQIGNNQWQYTGSTAQFRALAHGYATCPAESTYSFTAKTAASINFIVPNKILSTGSVFLNNEILTLNDQDVVNLNTKKIGSGSNEITVSDFTLTLVEI